MHFLCHCYTNWVILFLIHCVNSSLQRCANKVFVASPSLTVLFVSRIWSTSRKFPLRLPSNHIHNTQKKVQLNPSRTFTLESTRCYTWLQLVGSYHWLSVIGRHHRHVFKCWSYREEVPPPTMLAGCFKCWSYREQVPLPTLLTCWIKRSEEGPKHLIHAMSSGCSQTWLEYLFHLFSVISQFLLTLLVAHLHSMKTVGFTSSWLWRNRNKRDIGYLLFLIRNVNTCFCSGRNALLSFMVLNKEISKCNCETLTFPCHTSCSIMKHALEHTYP